MRLIILSLFLLVTLSSGAQVSKTIEKTGHTLSPNQLRKHLEILAAPEMEGRASATMGQKKAGDYIEKQFKKLGLLPLLPDQYQLPFNVYRDTVMEANIRVNDQAYQRDHEFGVYTDMNHACDLRYSEVVFAKYGIKTEKRNDYEGLDVQGKLVVVLGGEPMKDGKYVMNGSTQKGYWYYPPAKVQAAASLGAGAILIIEKEFPMIMYNNKLSSLWVSPYTFIYHINTFFISEKIAREIFKEKYNDILMGIEHDTLSSIETVFANIDLTYSRRLQKLETTNVFGMIEGTQYPDEYVFIMAHYDHIGVINDLIHYGADDNASGTAALIKLADAFVQAKKAGHGPKRSVVFAAFSGEENGLWGSAHYAKDPILPHEKTSVGINMDMIGRTDFSYQHTPDSSNNLFVIGNDKLSSDLRDINDRNNSKLNLKLDYKYNDLDDPNYFFYRSDHFNFADKGVPVLFYTDGEHADYHKHTDTIDKIDYGLLAKRSKLIFYTAWEIANMDRMLKRDIPLK